MPSGFSGWHIGLSFNTLKTDDYLEIKDFAFNGEELLVEGPETVKDATGYQSDHGVWNRGNGDQTEPVLERVFIDSEKK